MDAVCFQWSLVVKPTTLSQHGSSLLNYAVSKLNPEIFSHPVWVRFGKKEMSDSLSIVDDLLSAAKNLQGDDPSGACQIMLICAVYQNYSSQRYKALKTTQQTLSLAEHTNLARELIWAIWGACAISIQQGNYEQAESHFVDLQAAFSKQNEWMLANFIDVLRQSLLQPVTVNMGKHSQSSRDQPFADLLTFTFDWLQHWGLSVESSETEFDVISSHPVSQAITHSTLIQSFFSIQRWQGRWHSLMLAIRGELRLQWTKNDSPSTKRRFSFWGSILSSLRLYLTGQKIDTQARDDIPQISNMALLLPAKESSPPKTKTRRKKPVSKVKKINRNQRSGPATTVMPVAVHMLGAFSMTIGDLTVKLPASRGLSVLKYLLLHHKQNISREVLMDIFWPDAEPQTARNNLNVAMHGLRKALRNIIFLPVIIFEDGAYGLEPNLKVWLDVEEFERCSNAGQRLEARDQLTASVAEYETAISLYQGDFLESNPYEEWTILDRERLRVAYLDTLDRLSQIYFSQERYAACIAVCQLILNRDRCREDAHCLLMRCYSRQRQHHLALYQYQVCVEALRAELDVEPAPETTKLYEQIRRRERV
jgi:DNA-binding SARP family transcriptional activator